MNLKQYQKLKETAERCQREADQAQGAYDQKMQQLQEEFDCATLIAARKLHKQLQRELKEAEQQYQQSLDAFIQKWGDKL